MANWNEILDEIQQQSAAPDILRKKYLKKLNKLTQRNIIVYYSGWLQKPAAPGLNVNDADKNGLMAVINKLDRSKGLDLILHTPGGDTAATESIVDYLRSMFGTDIRVIIPQLAMSAGTMMACASKEIIMGKHSSLGPIDPQFQGIPTHGVIEEFNTAKAEMLQDPRTIPLWQPIISKYPIAFIGECIKAIQWSVEMVKNWLKTGMFSGEPDAEVDPKIQRIIEELANHAVTKSHARHLSAEKCSAIGLKIKLLEDDQALQDAVLSVHHVMIHTLSATTTSKIIANHVGTAYVQHMAIPS